MFRHLLRISGDIQTQTETAPIDTKKLLKEIIPRFSLPVALGSDNGLAFMVTVSQILTDVLNINLHCVFRSERRGQLERMRRTLEETDKIGPGNW